MAAVADDLASEEAGAGVCEQTDERRRR